MTKLPKPPPGRAAVRELCDPSPRDRQRVREGLDRSVARGAASQTVLRVDASMAMRALGVPETASVWASKAGLAKLLLPAALVGSGLGALWWPLQGDDAVAPAPQALPVPLRVEDLPPVEPEQLPLPAAEAPASPKPVTHAPVHHAHPSVHHAPVHRTAPPAAPEPPPTAAVEEPAPLARVDPPPPNHHLAEELRLMRAASAALNADDATGALRILTDHSKRFPDGALARERSALRTIGLCKQRAPEARRERDAFLRSADLSPLAARVRKACEDVK